MTDKSEALAFEKIATRLQQPLWGKDRLSIWGGSCEEAELSRILMHWRDLWCYEFWEWTDDCRLSSWKGNNPSRFEYLERGRLFGPGGDLELRRDGFGVSWRLIAPSGVRPPAGLTEPRDYWAVPDHAGLAFHCREERYLLWGREVTKGRWHEDRMAWAELKYPLAEVVPGLSDQAWEKEQGRRVCVSADLFSLAGSIQFVWFKKLEACDGDWNR